MPTQRNTTGWSYNNAADLSKTAARVPANRITGAGKKATAQKNQLYSKPIPVDLDASTTSMTPESGETLWSSLCTLLTLGYYSPGSSPYSVPSITYKGKEKVKVYYDQNLQTIWVEDLDQGVRLLWQRGFFGKGNLSRSEPTWRQRKVNEIDALRKGRLTAEQLTQQRREERKALKIERARAAVRAGQQLPDGILALGGEITDADRAPGASHDRLMADIERQVEEQLDVEDAADEDGADSPTGRAKAETPVLWTGQEEVPDIVPGVARIKGLKYFAEEVKASQARKAAQSSTANADDEKTQVLTGGTDADDTVDINVVDVERMQLSLVEAFFLSAMFGCLDIRTGDVESLSIQDFYTFCLQSSLPHSLLDLRNRGLAERHLQKLYARPDNPFLINYVAYHHFRSLGWVVKTGIKFCSDLLLYKRGPVFSHAEFAVIIIPSYEEPEDEVSSPFTPHPNAGRKDWIWFSTVNRVQSQVLKTLILAHVFVPSLKRCPPEAIATPDAFYASLREGKSYAVKEVAIRRWVPARMKP
ncbi:related to tRNA splicing endonuclease beta subunit [Melanopsichium pennsylvanicum]|uniref:tRNA-intron lyase n=2 Tax=Melanopsichium pennsylvanicum TaxID=63383 RepID=A0AAJ4XIX1_9BASI|nr:related to tRNA splicing endonuclease beta subunit [Melanopsichium pennsylvanicum 4]SNX83469.1 related to tRNA splicing endonuclease beta subunit [Melanopsichium pennsylvanicum]